MSSPTPPIPTSAPEATTAPAPMRRRHTRSAQGRVFRRTTMRRAVAEGMLLFLAGRLLTQVPVSFWPAALFPLVLVVRLGLSFSPPVWAALRVRSTRREKMSRRFWRLGPILAALCALLDTLVALALGDALLFGGSAGPPDLVRLTTGGRLHLTLGAFLWGEVALFMTLAIYYTIAVICTRLANGGFLRFTMPAGNGRVTL